MTAASINGLTIEYEEYGDPAATPLLLVMGLGTQLLGWPEEFVQRLADRGFRVVRYDNRDVGKSSEVDAPVPTPRQQMLALVSPRFAKPAYLIRDMADDAAGLLDRLGIERAHVVGASMGGMIAQTLAIHHPDRVRSLTSIMSNTGDRKHGRVSRKLLRQAPSVFRRDGDPVERAIKTYRLTSGPHFDAADVRAMAEAAIARHDDAAGTARQMMAIAGSPDRTWDLRRVQVPTLVVHGLADPLVMPSGGIATAKAIRGSRLVMYPDMGHDLPRPRWDDIIGEIVATARRADGGEANDRMPAA